MPIPHQHRAVHQPLNSESDPCSFSYHGHDQMSGALPPSSSVAPTREHSPAPKRKHNGWGKRFVGTFKKVWRGKSDKKSNFVAPPEYKQLHRSASKNLRGMSARSSVRSRGSNATMMTNKRISAPPIVLTGPTVRGRNNVRVHSYSGRDASPLKGENVRFSHPTVNNVSRPRTPSSPTAGWRPDQDRSPGQRSTWSSGTSGEKEDSDGPAPIRPKNIWRESGQFNTAEGDRTSFDEFKARLDGHPFETESGNVAFRKRVDSRPPSLGYLARLPDIDMSASLPPTPTVRTPNLQNNRDQAFKMLQNGDVLAVVPKEDLPASAVPVLSKGYPPALTATQYPRPLMHVAQPKPRPQSWAYGHQEEKFEAFSPNDFIAFNPAMKHTWDASLPQSPTRSEKRHGKVLADADIQNANDLSRPKTPDVFATTNQHKHHYTRVESQIFDRPIIPLDRPSAPTPPPSSSHGSIQADQPIGPTFVNSPTPPATPMTTSSLAACATRQKLTEHKAASTTNVHQKPVSATPIPPVPQVPENLRPTAHTMNDNGFPIMDLRNARTSFSAEPKYERRSVNELEAKFRKENPPKKIKVDKKTAKLEKEKAELEKKIAKQQEKIAKQQEKVAKKVAKTEKKKADALKKRPDLVQQQQQVDDGVKKLLLI